MILRFRRSPDLLVLCLCLLAFIAPGAASQDNIALGKSLSLLWRASAGMG